MSSKPFGEQPCADIRIDIGTLELQGFARRDQDAIQRAFHAELHGLVASRGQAWAEDLSTARLPGDRPLTATTALDGTAANIGANIARAVFRSLRVGGDR